MDGDGIGAELDCLFDSADQLLCVWVGTKRRSTGKMNNQPDVLTCTSVACLNNSFVHQDGVGTTGYDIADGCSHVRKTINRAYGNAMVHRYNYCPVGIAVPLWPA